MRDMDSEDVKQRRKTSSSMIEVMPTKKKKRNLYSGNGLRRSKICVSRESNAGPIESNTPSNRCMATMDFTTKPLTLMCFAG